MGQSTGPDEVARPQHGSGGGANLMTGGMTYGDVNAGTTTGHSFSRVPLEYWQLPLVLEQRDDRFSVLPETCRHRSWGIKASTWNATGVATPSRCSAALSPTRSRYVP